MITIMSDMNQEPNPIPTKFVYNGASWQVRILHTGPEGYVHDYNATLVSVFDQAKQFSNAYSAHPSEQEVQDFIRAETIRIVKEQHPHEHVSFDMNEVEIY